MQSTLDLSKINPPYLPPGGVFGGSGGIDAGARGTGTGAARWEGILPARCTDPSAGFSPKVFLGGLPYDITEHALMYSLRQFHPVR